MEKFSKIQDQQLPAEEETLLKGHFDVIKYKNTEIVVGRDAIAVLPYMIDEGMIFMRLEYLPAYQYKNKDNQSLKKITNYLSVITGGIEKGESPQQALRRELFEEGGIVVSNMYDFDIEGPFFESKYGTKQLYTCIMELRANHYKQVKPPTDGSKGEKMSKNIKVSLGDIDHIITNDLITKFLLTKLKSDYKI